jgi:probable rRNA maturation factor
MPVAVVDEVGYDGLSEETASRLFAASFSRLGLDLGRVGEVREKDEPTDVLSFEVDGPYGEMVGEVVICPPCAEIGVEELVVHGALHLGGMDHGEDFETSEMAAVQGAVMEELRGQEG